MAATLQVNSLGRGPAVLVVPAFASVTITGNSATYGTASGGLPFDLTTSLQTISASAMPGGQAPNYQQTINPNDILGIMFLALSTNGFLPANFTLGTPTYTAVPWQSDNGPAATPGILATCPCTMRLWGTGSANHAALAEVADGANTDVATVLLAIARNGANS